MFDRVTVVLFSETNMNQIENREDAILFGKSLGLALRYYVARDGRSLAEIAVLVSPHYGSMNFLLSLFEKGEMSVSTLQMLANALKLSVSTIMILAEQIHEKRSEFEGYLGASFETDVVKVVDSILLNR